MEYKLSTASTWTAITGTVVTGRTPGTYEVRLRATASAFSGTVRTVTINPFAQATTVPIRVSLFAGGSDINGLSFAARSVGYAAVGPVSPIVTNVGTAATGAMTVALSGAGAGSFVLTSANLTSINPQGTTTFTIAPRTGLSIGTHTATVTISGPGIVTKVFSVSFTVTA